MREWILAGLVAAAAPAGLLEVERPRCAAAVAYAYATLSVPQPAPPPKTPSPPAKPAQRACIDGACPRG